jgi:hypothetical protein
VSGLFRNADHRYYVSGTLRASEDEAYSVEVGPLVSVTTALKALDKSNALVGWAKRTVAEIAVAKHDILGPMIEQGGAPAAVNWLKGMPDYQRDTAAYLGSRIHMLAEAINNDQPISEEDALNPKVRQYIRFVAEWEPQFVGVEQMVVNFSEGYAGTADIWCRLPTGETLSVDTGEGIRTERALELWLIDIKTSNLTRGPYEDHWLQLAGLNGGEWWGWPDKEELEPAQHAQRFGILQLADNDYTLWEGKVGPAEYDAFVNVLKTHKWLNGPLKDVKVGKVKRESAA